jgi:hypothetical protein
MRIIMKQSITNFWLLALLSLVSAGCAQRAGGNEVRPPAGQNANAPTATVPSSLSPAHANTVRVWRDYSKSIDEETLAKIANELAGAIMRHKEQIVGIEVVRFANGTNSVWAELPVKFIWGPAPEISEFKPNLDNAPTDTKLFKDAMKRYIEGEHRKHEEEEARLLSEYKAHVEEQLKRFTDYLLQGPTVGAPCTRFTTLAERMRTEDLPYSVLITDGWADCPNEKNHSTDGVVLHGKHVILQLTRHADSQADDEDFLQREAFLHTLFPTSKVVPASMPDQAIEFMFQ